jgi:hypothetical protein
MKMVEEQIIEEYIMDNLLADIKTCGVMNGSRPKEDCSYSCKYRKICDDIFAFASVETELAQNLEQG